MLTTENYKNIEKPALQVMFKNLLLLRLPNDFFMVKCFFVNYLTAIIFHGLVSENVNFRNIILLSLTISERT